jgi:hypothetical protein
MALDGSTLNSSMFPFYKEGVRMLPLLVKCDNCNKYFTFSPPFVSTGNGATLRILGRIKTHCPYCGGEASAPGGEFGVSEQGVKRRTSNLTPLQIEAFVKEFRGFTTMNREQLMAIVSTFSPEVSAVLAEMSKALGLEKPSSPRTMAIAIAALLLVLNHSRLNVDVKVDVKLDVATVVQSVLDFANDARNK